MLYTCNTHKHHKCITSVAQLAMSLSVVHGMNICYAVVKLYVFHTLTQALTMMKHLP